MPMQLKQDQMVLKDDFCKEMGSLIREISISEKVFLGQYLNEHVRKDSRVQESPLRTSFWRRNEQGDNILEFASALTCKSQETLSRKGMSANAYFKKKGTFYYL